MRISLSRRLLVAAATLAAAQSAHAQDVTFRIAHFLPAVASTQKIVLQPWCDEMGQLSSGRIKCQFYPSMQLGGTPAQLADQVKNGVADIAWTAPGYSTGRFPKTEALELPGVLPLGGLAGGRAIWDFFGQHLKDEYKDYKVLAMHGDGGMNIHTASKALATVEDFKGVKLRSPNRTIARTLTALGATPVAMPPAQVTEAIAKGVVDGASAVWEVMLPTKLDEVTKFHFETPADRPVMGATVLVLLMNKQKYEALPADLKAIIDKTSGAQLVERYGKAWDEASIAARNKIKSAPGHTLTVVSGAKYDAILKQAEVVEKEWLADAKSKGINGEALVAAARAAARKQSN
ncbi:TRAP transporter substrate-binding protein [Dechloromonas denitrificans]|uniref:TRAP transporter substrate-binding protein n=1 Tax=Dechloromonas denitrificans TaxID=281362 RepID=UPI001CF8FA7F|nr:TRAP transporter substrate-binding protein [Dechloromonas denitrificans]UCV11872.1 TRAP transporter substrate-binding protein [Dechloromonas denitrificans]